MFRGGGASCALARRNQTFRGRYPSGNLSTKIPQGRHLLVLAVDEYYDAKHDTKPAATDFDRPCDDSGLGWPNDACPGARTIRQVDFYSRAALPNVTLEIAP